ncbi:hypothetical protein [Planktothrix sp. FACHB-1365]|uniref:hypothetical protein n=1 Tax=Planktothrix sp. FACHB-1365 TaxID=2692855 RepID=UPI0016866BFA|nr:hypothetical protein [Planktothrix sp. FACHB-1365]MBD2483753.1 hypothetical protein [Planktothrix sp. FACHB-1365]
MVNSDPLTIAETAIIEFERSKVPGVWTGLNKQQIIAEIRSRLLNPFNINQGSQPFCGPAAIIFELARKHPAAYIQLCRNLFQIGGFHTHTNRWIPSPVYLQQSQVNVKISQVDWMVLSTLRESENLIFSVDPNAPQLLRNLAGITKPWEIGGWTQEILGYQTIHYHYAYLFGDLEAIQKANQIVKSGGVAFGLINDFGLLLNKPPVFSYPSHWVALLDQLNIDYNRNMIEFNLFTWGQQMQIKVDIKTFKTYFWAVVTGI